ncbi:MAG: signal recognition particle-docking protein FtsY [Burkholderiaceae bacterium]|nr:signal recognition particle-docking protein FtsY [Burkholderiaceae bacterium]
MFRFFKKKPTQSESSVEDQLPTPASHESEHIPDQSLEKVIVPETETEATPAVPAQTPFRRSAFASALSGVGSTGVTVITPVEPPQPIVAFEPTAQAESIDPVEQNAPQVVNEQPEQLEPELSEQNQEKKASWLARLKGGLAKTGQSIGSLFVGVRVDEALFEELETALIMADSGVEATEQLLTTLRMRVKRDRIEDAEGVRQALREVLTEHLQVLEKPFDVGRVKPLVVMITGVNGAGKTTSTGKLAFALQHEGARVLLVAGDTFRAAARQQLIEWGARNKVDVIAQEGADPAAVAFDAVHAGRARGMDVVMVDTAGRLPTQLHLMDELKKIRRVIAKADPTAPHEVLLVVDGNSGQNVLAQIRAFDAAVGLTGLIVTKLDGTAKGGTLAAVAAGSQGVRPVPVYWIGVGEKIEDLQPFVAAEFAAAVVG